MNQSEALERTRTLEFEPGKLYVKDNHLF